MLVKELIKWRNVCIYGRFRFIRFSMMYQKVDKKKTMDTSNEKGRSLNSGNEKSSKTFYHFNYQNCV